MKKNKDKKVLFLGLGVMIIVALILVLIFVSSDKENNTSQQTSVDLNNLEDIYAKISDFDRILEKPGVTKEEKQNAVKNARIFLDFCEKKQIEHNNNLPEWNEEEKEEHAQFLKSTHDWGVASKEERISYSIEDAREKANSLSRHANYLDIQNSKNLYRVVDDKSNSLALDCIVGKGGVGPPATFATYRVPKHYHVSGYTIENEYAAQYYSRDPLNESQEADKHYYRYYDTRSTSLYDGWGNEQIVEEYSSGRFMWSEYIQYTGA